MIKPTVGRVVWFWHNAHDQSPYAAIIAAVWTDVSISLMVINHDGTTRGETSVHLHQEGQPRPAGRFAEWMPYQKGQAAKTDALLQASNIIDPGCTHPNPSTLTTGTTQ